MRELTIEELCCVGGGESDPTGPGAGFSAGYGGNYGISDEIGPDQAAAVGAAISTLGAVVRGPAGIVTGVVRGFISTAVAAGYTVPQGNINAGYIEYGMSVAESYGGQYNGSSFGNDFGDPNGPGANTNTV